MSRPPLSRSWRSLLWLSLVLALTVSGCENFRNSGYPQDFIYLEPSEIRGQMARMSLYMRQIDDILAEGTTISSEQQARLVPLLVSIDEVTNRLGAGDVETSHMLIDERIDDFKADVNLALDAARADPPNYFNLGKLAGSCAGCHEYR